jgi:Lysine methyltransferase
MDRKDHLRMLRQMRLDDEAARAAATDEEDAQGNDSNNKVANEIVTLSTGASVLQYDKYLSHQRYHDDLKHIDCRYIDFGCLCPTRPQARLVIEQDKTLGKGGLCWDAAYILANHIILHHNSLLPPPVQDYSRLQMVELGCGTGLCGLMLAQALPNVYIALTDLPLLMPLLKRNLERNMPSECIVSEESASSMDGIKVGADKLHAISDKVASNEQAVMKEYITKAHNLSYSQTTDSSSQYTSSHAPAHTSANQYTSSSASLISSATVSAFVLDWAHIPPSQLRRYDVVLGADVVASLYDPIALTETIRAVCHKQSIVLVCFRNRLASIQADFEGAMAVYFDIEVVKPDSVNRNEQVYLLIGKPKVECAWQETVLQ